MEYFHLVAENFCESFHIVGTPCLVDFSVFSEIGFHQVERGVDANEGIAERTECNLNCSAYVLLTAFKEFLHVAHNRFEILRFVKEHAVPCADLVFPVLLPFGEGVFLQHFVGGYDEHGSGGFKANSSFYADYCVADMHVASDAEFRSRLFDGTDGVDAVFICLAVDGSHLAFVECDAECLFSRCRDLTGIGAVGKCLLAVKSLFAADARSPQTFVDGIFHFLIVGVDSVFLR